MITREEITVKMGLDSSGIAAKSHEASALGEQAGHFLGHGLQRSLRKMFHVFTLGGLLRETFSLAKEYESVKDDAEKLEEAFGHLTESQKNAFESMAKSAHKAEIAIKQSFATILGSIADAGELFGTMLFAGVGPNKAAEMMIKERAEDEIEKAGEKRQAEKEAFAEWVKDHITRKNMTKEEEVMYLHDMMMRKVDRAYETEDVKKQFELLREAHTIKQEILGVEKEITDEHNKQLEKQRKLEEDYAKHRTKLLRDYQHELKNLQDAQAPDKPGVGDIDPSGKGHWERNWNSTGRFWVPNRLTPEDIRARDKAEKIEELKAAAEHTSDMLDKFYNEGFQFKSGE